MKEHFFQEMYTKEIKVLIFAKPAIYSDLEKVW